MVGPVNALRAGDVRTSDPLVIGAAGERRRFRRVVVASDLAVLSAVVLLVATLRTGVGSSPWGTRDAVLSAVTLTVLVLVALPVCGCWDARIVARGGEESRRIIRALASAAVAAAFIALAAKDSTLRPWVFLVLPLLAVLLVAGRRVQRARLRRARRQGRGRARVLAVGPAAGVSSLIERSRGAPENGWLVVAACTPDLDAGVSVLGVPVAGGPSDVVEAARELAVDRVAVAPGAADAPTLRRLAWALEGSGRELVVDPGLMEVSSARVRMDELGGLPLLRLDEPGWRGPGRWPKVVLDRLTALAALLVLAPVLVLVTLAVVADGGPPVYRQVRVGRDGVPFNMLKFRSMRVGAEDLLDGLVVQRGGAHDGAGPLFKLRRDPRVTRVGRVLRRYSLDELPQLFNVLSGAMSLVGPRPPLPSEVGLFSEDARRRLAVRPGMTGLWQVSGRSDLSWEESVRLDLQYVDTWSHALDLSILARTLGAVVGGRGAY